MASFFEPTFPLTSLLTYNALLDITAEFKKIKYEPTKQDYLYILKNKYNMNITVDALRKRLNKLADAYCLKDIEKAIERKIDKLPQRPTGLAAYISELYGPQTPEAPASRPADTATITTTAKGLTIDAPKLEKRITSYAELCEFFKLNPNEWVLERLVCNAWEMGYVDKNTGQSATQPLYQCKATLLPNVKYNTFKEITAELLKNLQPFRSDSLLSLGKNQVTSPTDNFVLFSIPDIHLGKLAWKAETGDDYDLKIASEAYMSAYRTLVNRVFTYLKAPAKTEILYVIGNDLLHVDNKKATTTAGTPMDADTRFHKIFSQAVELATATIIDLQSKFKKVHVVIVPGNHDNESSYFVGEVLKAYFRNNENVAIDNAPNPLKTFRHEKLMFCFSHGDKMKQYDMPLVFATADRKNWGESKFTYIFLGHLHQNKISRTEDVTENRGVKIIHLPSLCGSDAWHHENGYKGIRAAQSWVFNRESGEEVIFNYNLP